MKPHPESPVTHNPQEDAFYGKVDPRHELTAHSVFKQLHELADWFDSPMKSPLIRTPHGTPGMMLREIARELHLHMAKGEFLK